MKLLFCITMLSAFLGFAQGDDWQNTTICWDRSYSMINRDIEKEFNILDKVFQKYPNQVVQLLLFSNNVEELEFTIVDGNWTEIRQVLVNARPDGATLYNNLKESIKNDIVYFFTDGKSVVSTQLLPVAKGNIIINTSTERNVDNLQKAALIGRGRLMDVAAILPENLLNSQGTGESNQTKTISGRVYMDAKPAENIDVRIKGESVVYKTDINGRFKLLAVAGDSILVSSKTFRTMKTVPVGYFDSTLDIFMVPNITNLEEVVVTESRMDSYAKGLVNTGLGLKKKEGVGYAVSSIDGDKITEINTDIATAVSGKFSGVQLSIGQDLTTFSTRLSTSMLGNNYGLIVVDGVPMQQSDSSVYSGFSASSAFIDPENIADVTVLRGLAATNRYGTLGSNGVMLITTKNALYSEGSEGRENMALVKNNLFDPKAQIIPQESAVTLTLNKELTLEKAYEKYLDLRNFNQDNAYFFLDAFTFFMDKDAQRATRIISNLWEQFPEDEVYARTVALAAEVSGDWQLAKTVNGFLNNRRPLVLQPFFNEGRYRLVEGKPQEALNSWTTLAKGGRYGTMNVNAIQKTLDREIKNLIFKEKENLDLQNVEEKYQNNERMNVRLLLEWNDPKAEFKVQFVNPDNRYFNWEHNSSANARRIEEEVALGYGMEEFEVYDDLKGDWQVNVNYQGNLDEDSNRPLVLRCTMYTNYGYPSQKREYILVYLDYKNPRKNMVKFKI